MTTTPAHAGKVVLFDRTSGQRLERWPVDARELLATGGYTTDPTTPAPAPSPVPAPSVAERVPAPARRRRPVASES